MAMIGASTHGAGAGAGAGALKPSPVAPSSALLWFASTLRRSPATWRTHHRTCGRMLSSLDRPHDRKRRESQSPYRFGKNAVSCQYGSEELNGAASFVNESIGCSSAVNSSGKSSLELGMFSAVGSDRLQMQRDSKSEWVKEGQKYRLVKMAEQVRKEIRSGRIQVTGSYPDSRAEFLNDMSNEYANFCSAAVLSESLGSSTIDDLTVLNGKQFASSDAVSELFPRISRSESKVEKSPQKGEGIHSRTEVIKSVVQNGRISQNVSNMKPDSRISNGTISTVQSGVALMDDKEKLAHVYEKVLIVDNVSTAKEVVKVLTTKYKNVIHACDTEVANIDVKSETPVGHGEIICFSICPGLHADFGNGKSCIWVDVLDGGKDVLMEFVPFFEDASIKKVWHNYSFDSHIVNNYGIKLAGFHADTMHLARLWDSSRRADGGYSLEALTSNSNIMSEVKHDCSDDLIMGKISMKTIFAKKKLKKDGSEGKQSTLPPVEVLQREERKLWICYSALDSLKTSELFYCLKAKLTRMPWTLDGIDRGTMYDFYEEYWHPFGALLVKMEAEGMLVDRSYLSEIEKVAIAEQQIAADRFRKWASKYCPDAKYMNVGSDTQIRQLLFGGIQNSKNQNEHLPFSKTFKVPNTENVIEDGKKTPSKYRNIELYNIAKNLKTDMYTASGWPSVSGAALKVFAGKISTDLIYQDDDENDEGYYNSEGEEVSESSSKHSGTEDTSSYGTAYFACGEGREGRDACHAIAALCEVCSIDSLISNFILPLQGNHISCCNGRVHCSLNINTETGRLSARRPNLQNQPALEKDRYKIRQAFIAEPGNSLIVADYGQLELRILAHLAHCKSMLEAFEAGGDFHSRTAMNMYDHVRKAVEEKQVILEWYPQPGQEKPPVPLLKDAFAAERRKAKMLNFSIAYGKTPVGLSRDWKVSVKEAKKTVDLWYKERQEVLKWQEARKEEARTQGHVRTLLGRSRRFPSMQNASNAQRGHIERAAINTPVQGSAADVAMCAMLEIDRNIRLKELGWRLLLQVHDEVILEGPSESAELAKAIVVECMSKPFYGTNILSVDLSVDAKCEKSWYAAK